MWCKAYKVVAISGPTLEIICQNVCVSHLFREFNSPVGQACTYVQKPTCRMSWPWHPEINWNEKTGQQNGTAFMDYKRNSLKKQLDMAWTWFFIRTKKSKRKSSDRKSLSCDRSPKICLWNSLERVALWTSRNNQNSSLNVLECWVCAMPQVYLLSCHYLCETVSFT